MRRVTAICAGRGKGKRVNVFLDGDFAFSVEAEVAVKDNLRVEQELSDGQIEALVGSDNFRRCYEAAAHFLSYRPRSERELKERLTRRGFGDVTIEAVIARLKEHGLVDDIAFARFWRDNRQSFNPRSRWLTALELRRKGVAKEIIDRAVHGIDDEDSAYSAALNRARRLPRSDYHSFHNRLSGYLRRRGFSHGVVNRTVELIWREQEQGRHFEEKSEE
jgi:regulatory protein